MTNNYPDDVNDEFMQYLMDQLNKSYSQFKKDHPSFAKIVEEQCEGKTDEEFEAQFTKKMTCSLGCKKECSHCPHCGEYNYEYEILDGRCHECFRHMRCSCGKMLVNRDMCQSCGKINL